MLLVSIRSHDRTPLMIWVNAADSAAGLFATKNGEQFAQPGACPVGLPVPAFAMSCRYCDDRPASPRMNSWIPFAYAACAAAIDGPLPPPPAQLFGWPSVVSKMIGGEAAGGLLTMKSAATLSIASAVGVLPLFGGLFASNVFNTFELLSARGAEKPVRLRHG